MRCPGQDKRFWLPDDVTDIDCGHCGHSMEFFKDEGTRRCPACGKRVVNPQVSIGCAQWCAHAKECLGYDPKEGRLQDETQSSLVDQLLEAMKSEFGDDHERINHALEVLDCAECLLKTEGADPRVVIAAAILHDIGIQEAERKHGSPAGRFQELEGPPIAGRILKELGFDLSSIEHVCKIIAHHHSDGFDTREFRVLWDADNLVNAREVCDGDNLDEIRRRLAKILKTDSGRQMAEKIFAKMSGNEAAA